MKYLHLKAVIILNWLYIHIYYHKHSYLGSKSKKNVENKTTSNSNKRLFNGTSPKSNYKNFNLYFIFGCTQRIQNDLASEPPDLIRKNFYRRMSRFRKQIQFIFAWSKKQGRFWSYVKGSFGQWVLYNYVSYIVPYHSCLIYAQTGVAKGYTNSFSFVYTIDNLFGSPNALPHY